MDFTGVDVRTPDQKQRDHIIRQLEVMNGQLAAFANSVAEAVTEIKAAVAQVVENTTVKVDAGEKPQALRFQEPARVSNGKSRR